MQIPTLSHFHKWFDPPTNTCRNPHHWLVYVISNMPIMCPSLRHNHLLKVCRDFEPDRISYFGNVNLVATVRDRRPVVMRVRNLDLWFRIGRVIRIMSNVQRILKSDGVINVGVIRRNITSYLNNGQTLSWRRLCSQEIWIAGRPNRRLGARLRRQKVWSLAAS